jgi:SRSO17 transposase
VSTQEDRAVAAGHSVEGDDPLRWQAGLDELMGRIGGRFWRVEPRRRARAFLLGLMAGLPRVNCWTIAEHAGDASPDGMQHLLAGAVWDSEGVRDDLRGYVVERLGDPGAVLVVDETGDVKKGVHTVGVQRQYTGTAGRIENSQVGVYLVYAAPAGHAFIDRALYLPRSWADHRDRCAAAGVPDEVGFATKPALARAMIGAALDAGTPASWVAGDEVYGNDPRLRADLASRGVGYVLAVAKDHRITTGIGVRKAIDLAVRLPPAAWQRLSAGAGAKGQRLYEWALVETTDPAAGGAGHWLLIRRNLRTREMAFYRAHSPSPVPVQELVRVAGQRWKIEESFQTGKELAGLDEHQVRTWTSWHRWTVLAMLAHAFLSVMAATQPASASASASAPKDELAPLIPLTRNEIRRLFATLLGAPIRDISRRLRWSRWRRRHQARARRSHYQRQAARLT